MPKSDQNMNEIPKPEPRAVVVEFARPESSAAAREAISVRNLSKTYRGQEEVKALDGVSLAISEREFVSILGPSGCGKSTLLRMVAGLAPYDSGELMVNGRPVTKPSPEVGVVFQSHNMLPWLTVEQNMALGAKLRKIPEAEYLPRVRSLIATLCLGGFERSYPHQLSGGMRQRAAIGQILALEPAILLMDEPFGALDALTRDRLNVELLRVWQEKRQTALFITHSIAEAVFLSDRVMVMSDRPGKIVHDIRIDLPRPRRPETLKGAPRYGEYIAELSRLMGVF